MSSSDSIPLRYRIAIELLPAFLAVAIAGSLLVAILRGGRDRAQVAGPTRVVPVVVAAGIVVVVWREVMASVGTSTVSNPETLAIIETWVDLFPVLFVLVFLGSIAHGIARSSRSSSSSSRDREPWRKHSTTTFGRARRVDVVDVVGGTCIRCETNLVDVDEGGERRVWADELVVAGVPIRQYEGGEHRYCDPCTDPLGPDPLVEAELEAGAGDVVDDDQEGVA